MTKAKLRRLVDLKQREADKHNRMIYLEIKKGNCINAYDLIKEEYMKGKYGTLTDSQLEMICDKCNIQGHGGICTTR